MDQAEKTENTNDAIKIDRKSKLLFAVLAFLIVGSVAATYWRIVVKRNYIVQAQTDCDPETENCFVWECDPESTEEGIACTGDPETDIWYYKIIRRNAKNIPLCDPNDENCAALVCEENEEDCSFELCSEENVPEGESCNDPEQYILENPAEEEEECAEDDEECLTAQEEAVACAEEDEECLTREESVVCEEGDEECFAENEKAGAGAGATLEESMDDAAEPISSEESTAPPALPL